MLFNRRCVPIRFRVAWPHRRHQLSYLFKCQNSLQVCTSRSVQLRNFTPPCRLSHSERGQISDCYGFYLLLFGLLASCNPRLLLHAPSFGALLVYLPLKSYCPFTFTSNHRDQTDCLRAFAMATERATHVSGAIPADQELRRRNVSVVDTNGAAPAPQEIDDKKLRRVWHSTQFEHSVYVH